MPAEKENMFRKILSFTLIVLLLNVIGISPVYAAAPKQEKGARKAEKVKASILKLGIGIEARVQVRLKNNSTVKGYISEANDKNFVVIDDKRGITTTIPYLQVRQVNRNNLATGVAKFAIGLAIIIGGFSLLGIAIAKGTR